MFATELGCLRVPPADDNKNGIEENYGNLGEFLFCTFIVYWVFFVPISWYLLRIEVIMYSAIERRGFRELL